MGLKYSIKEIKELFESRGCKLLQDYYEGARVPVKYQCSCGTISQISIDNFRRGRNCQKCGRTKTMAKMKLPIEKVKLLFQKQGFRLLSTEYKNNQQSLKYRCHCGQTSRTALIHIEKTNGCRKCMGKKRAGKNAWNYNSTITPEQRQKSRRKGKQKKWRYLVKLRDDWACQCCGHKGLKNFAHHLYDYFHFRKFRHETWNGITMCPKCHGKFHSIYKKQIITPELFLEFLEIREAA